MSPSTETSASVPRLSVVVCTRNRGRAIELTIRSILASTEQGFEIIVVDQSDGHETHDAVTRGWPAESRLRYIRSDTRGLSAARNVGLHATSADVVLMTDDDCEVSPGWISGMLRCFDEHPQVALVYCNVVSGPFDPSQGFIPVCEVTDSTIKRMTMDTAGFGMGAGFAVRRTPAIEVGGFDPQLGAGARFKSGEEHDLMFRLLLRGYWVRCTAATHVVHHGFRAHADSARLISGYMLGYGAVFAKLVKCGYWIAAPAYALSVWEHGARPLLNNLVRGKRPLGVRRLSSFLAGFALGLKAPVDTRAQVYTSPL